MTTDAHYVYYLADPRDGEVRWVGITINPVQRFFGHYSPAHGGNPNAGYRSWLDDMRASGHRPVMGILEILRDVPTPTLKHAEKKWMCLMRKQGYKLTNRRTPRT